MAEFLHSLKSYQIKIFLQLQGVNSDILDFHLLKLDQ